MDKKTRMRLWWPRTQRVRRRYLTRYEHERILFYRKNEVPMTVIADVFGVSYSTVTDIVYGRSKPRAGMTGTAYLSR